MMDSKIEPAIESNAIKRAIEYGVDISLLIENLKLTPTERIEKLGRIVAFLEEARRAGVSKRLNDAS